MLSSGSSVRSQASVTLTADEVAAGEISHEHCVRATALLRCSGYVILRNAIDLELADLLRAEMAEIFADCASTPDVIETDGRASAVHRVHTSPTRSATFWVRDARWRIFPRLVPPLDDAQLLANPFVLPLLDDLLGAGFRCDYVASDTCVQGSVLQPPHSDIDPTRLFARSRWRPRGYVVNVPLVECGPENGAIEVWPGGSHLWTADLLGTSELAPNVQDGQNPAVEDFAASIPSQLLVLSPGDVLVRDPAMWHRGTPNLSGAPRTMLTIGYFSRAQHYGYGHPRYNLDETLHGQLEPQVRRIVRHDLGRADRARHGRQQIVRAAAKARRSLLGVVRRAR